MENNHTLSQSAENLLPKSRPDDLTNICILGFIGPVATIALLIFSSNADPITTWYPSYLVLSSIIGIVCVAGLWKMKKWAVYAYTALIVANQIIIITMGMWSVSALISPLTVAGFALFHLNKMD